MIKKTPELLAPAGSIESFEAAFEHGADAAYVGVGSFNLRAFTPNFTIDDIPVLNDIAEKYNGKYYATLNIMPSDVQLDKIIKLLSDIAEYQKIPDAFIISNPGVLVAAKEILGERTEYHLSTQTGTFNSGDMKFWKNNGISRVVLPREMNLSEVESITAKKICETEVFVHGAMCMSISGRCLLGAYLAERHPNHGVCPQPCRYKYRIAPAEKDGSFKDFIDVEESDNVAYFLNSKDLNTLSLIPEIIKTGVTSLKIEGRNKSSHYVSSVVSVYRKAIDTYMEGQEDYKIRSEWIEELERIDHRTYTTGFYSNDYILQDVNSSKAVTNNRVVGIVKGVMEGGVSVVDVKNPFIEEEVLSVLPVSSKSEPFSISVKRITDISGNSVDRAITNRLVVVEFSEKLRIGDILRRLI